MHFRSRALGSGFSRCSARASFKCRLKRYCQVGDGNDRHYGCSGSRPAGRFGQEFLRHPERRLTQLSANVILLDRVLAHYGPETKEARDLLRGAVARTLNVMWQQDQPQQSQVRPGAAGGEILYDKIQALSPANDVQRTFQSQASGMAVDLGKLRWLMFEQGTIGISWPLLAVLVFWLAIVFASFGLFAPPNPTVIVTLFLCALSVSGAIFLILEMYTPYQGLIQISSAPLRDALAHLGQ